MAMNNNTQSHICDYNSRLDAVKLTLNNNSVKLQWAVKGLKRYALTLGKPTPENLARVYQVALQIQSDIFSGNFDVTLDKYKLLHKPSLAIAQQQKEKEPISKIGTKLLNILELWQWYKSVKKGKGAKSTEFHNWKGIDIKLSLAPTHLLGLDKVTELVEFLRTCKHSKGIGYADSTIKSGFILLSACVELAKDLGKIPKTVDNLFAVWLDKDKGLLKLPPKKKILVYNTEQIQIIVDTFRNNAYDYEKRKHGTNDSYYTNFVLFRFLTGLRPSECVALTWSDIKFDKDQPKQIVISKRKVTLCEVDQGLKTTHQTNVQARIIPCNKNVRELILAIKQVKHKKNEHDLLFPASRGGYISQSDFNSKIWSKIIHGLLADGLLPYAIPFYDERHCNATHMIRSGVDIKTAASILGHSVDTMMNYYIGADESDDVVPNMNIQ